MPQPAVCLKYGRWLRAARRGPTTHLAGTAESRRNADETRDPNHPVANAHGTAGAKQSAVMRANRALAPHECWNQTLWGVVR